MRRFALVSPKAKVRCAALGPSAQHLDHDATCLPLAAAIWQGVVRFRTTCIGLTFTVRLVPSLRNPTLAAT